MFLCEEKWYLDKNIYNKITELKEIFMKNYKSINFFGFKSAELSNKEEVSKILLEIIKSLTLKIKELKD